MRDTLGLFQPPPSRDQVGRTGAMLDLLKIHPDGLTAKRAAAELNWPVGTTSSFLSRLALYGKLIDRVPVDGRHGRFYRYRRKQLEKLV